MTQVHNGGCILAHPAEQGRNLFDRPLGGTQPDALQAPAHQPIQPLERETEVRTALVARHRMDFVHDHRFCSRQEGAAAFGGQQDVKRFGSGDQDVGRALQHRPPFTLGCISRAHRHPQVGPLEAGLLRQVLDAGERLFEILADIVAKRLERGNIDDVSLVLEPTFDRCPHQLVDRPEEGG